MIMININYKYTVSFNYHELFIIIFASWFIYNHWQHKYNDKIKFCISIKITIKIIIKMKVKEMLFEFISFDFTNSLTQGRYLDQFLYFIYSRCYKRKIKYKNIIVCIILL